MIFKAPIDAITPEGIHFIPVQHSGCSQKSEEEGRVVKSCYKQLMQQKFDDGQGRSRTLTPEDILVVSPYNVQVNPTSPTFDVSRWPTKAGPPIFPLHRLFDYFVGPHGCSRKGNRSCNALEQDLLMFRRTGDAALTDFGSVPRG